MPATTNAVETANAERPRSPRAQPLEAAHSSYAVAEDGARIYLETFSPPAGSPDRRWPVLMIMGLGANGRLFAPAVRRTIAAGYHVITFDNRGGGRSSTPWRPVTTRTMARDAVAVLDELGVEQAHVGSASLGGMIAQELALEFPDRVSSMVLLATTGGFPRRPDLATGKSALHVFESMARSFRPGGDPERRVTDFLRMAATEDFVAECAPGNEYWDSVATMLEDPTSPRGFALQLIAALRHSTWSRLPRLRLPVQVHHGSEDTLIPLAAGRELAQRIPGAQFVLHPGAGHGLFETTDEVGRRITAFLGDCEARASASHVTK